MKSNNWQPVFHVTGAPYPNVPLPPGSMRLDEYVTNTSASLFLGIDMAGFTAQEKPAFLAGQLEVAIIGRPAHVRFAVDASPMCFDAPWAPGLNGPGWYQDLTTALQGPTKSLVIVGVDGGLVRAIKPVLMSAKAWEVLAAAVAACPAVYDPVAYDRACAGVIERWWPSDLLKAARCLPSTLSRHVALATT